MKKFTILILLTTLINVFSFAQNPNVTFSDIKYWVGSGTNEAILVLYFPDDDPDNAYAWGYRWNDTQGSTTYLKQMLTDINNDDPRIDVTGLANNFVSFTYTDPDEGLDFEGCDGMWMHTGSGAINGEPLYDGDIFTFYCYLAGGNLNALTVIPVTDPYYRVTATCSLNGNINPSGESAVLAGSFIHYYFLPDYGYTLDSVLLDDENITNKIVNNSYTITRIAKNMTIHATFKAMDTYTVTATSDVNGTVTPNGDSTIFKDESILYYFAANQGYYLDSIILDETTNIIAQLSDTNTFLLENIQDNHSIRAVYTAFNTENTYTIHAGFGGEWATQLYGTISPVGDSTVAEGSSITYTFTPNIGYHVGSVTLGGIEKIQDIVNNSYTVSNIIQDDTLWVLFAVDKNNTITTNDILYWIGEGTNEVIFAVNWCNPGIAFAWGYRFEGNKVLVSKLMDDIKATDARFNYTDAGGFVSEITYKDSTYDLALTGDYWMYNVNEGFADGISSQYVYHNDIIEFGDESCGLSDDFWNSAWTTEITPVSVPLTTSIVSLHRSTIHSFVYPNPANDHTFISINGIKGNISMKIVDINGKLIKTEQFYVSESTVKRIETNNFTKGVYFIHLQNNNIIQTNKMIVY